MSGIQKFNKTLLYFLISLFMLKLHTNDSLVEKIYAIFSLMFVLYSTSSLKFNLFLKLYLFFYFYLFLVGVFWNNSTSYLLFDLFSFSAPFLVLVRDRFYFSDFYFKILPKIGIYINILGMLFAFNHIRQFGLFFGSIDVGRGLDDPDTNIMSPKVYLYLSFFIYPLSIYVKEYKYLFIYNLSFLFFFIFSLAMASRGTSIVSVIVFLLVFFHKNRTRLNYVFLLKYFIFTTFLLYIFMKVPAINASINFLEYRLFEETETLGSERTEEADDIISNLSSNEILFGKGFGAANKYWIFANTPNGVNNVHYGWLFLILKGGLIFLLLIYGCLIFSFFKLVMCDPLRPYSFVILAFFLMEFTHQNSGNFMVMVFIYFSMAAGFIRRTEFVRNNNVVMSIH